MTPNAGKPAMKKGSQVVGLDTHVVMVPSPGGPVPTPMPMPFSGTLSDDLSPDVLIENGPVAVKGSSASNTPSHVPAGGSFQKPPSNKATVQMGSATVLINNKQVARAGDPAMTCNDPADAPNGILTGASTVLIGAAGHVGGGGAAPAHEPRVLQGGPDEAARRGDEGGDRVVPERLGVAGDGADGCGVGGEASGGPWKLRPAGRDVTRGPGARAR
jgi:uncharacterized Zn-binding protein involved in type VI secretion